MVCPGRQENKNSGDRRPYPTLDILSQINLPEKQKVNNLCCIKSRRRLNHLIYIKAQNIIQNIVINLQKRVIQELKRSQNFLIVKLYW